MWESSAPSNIALIKYMGKIESNGKNLPANSSLSWTTDHLRTFVQLEETGDKDQWQPMKNYPLVLAQKGQDKFLSHLSFLKKQFSLENRFFLIRSGNNFPADCGIASSASSFAALTKVAVSAFSDLTNQEVPSLDIQSAWSRQGSGSSCRSFFSGWVQWQEKQEAAIAVESPLLDILHMVVIVSGDKKKISSSDAHKSVQTSLLYRQRAERAQERYKDLKQELESSSPNWSRLYDLTWADFWDMHALFETSSPSFGYMTEKSLSLLRQVRRFWQSQGDGPIVTMDAGPNVHLLWRKDQLALARAFREHELDDLQVVVGEGFHV